MDLVAATPGAIQTVALAMRKRDLAEFSAVYPLDSRQDLAGLLASVYGSRNMLCGGLDGEPICIGGAVTVRPGTAALLFFATDAFPKIAKPMTRFIRRRFFPELAAEGVHRIEVASLTTYDEMHRWLGALGMQREGVLRAYGRRRENFAQFAKVM